MRVETWIHRLSDQNSGWKVWHTPGPRAGWTAAPVPPNTDDATAARSPYLLGPVETPQELRALIADRYGAGDFCDTCAVPWEECGHRRPETRDRHYAQPEQSKENQP